MPSARRGARNVAGQGTMGRLAAETEFRERAGVVAALTRFDPESIAGLSSVAIYDLTCEELVDVVRAADLPFLPPEVQGRLEFQDRHVLERLAFLARQCCRNRRRAEQPEAYE